MTLIDITSKSKSPSVPLLKRGRQVKTTEVDARFFRTGRKSFAARSPGWISPFAKGGQGGFALGEKGGQP